MKPHCFHFNPSIERICTWWESETDEPGDDYFCSLPDWEERTCETRGQRHLADAPAKEPMNELP